jgi:flagellar basal body rod protein FlgC
MVDALGAAASNALTGLDAAQNRIAGAATNIANSGLPQGQTTATQTTASPLTGGQIGNAAGQVGQALAGTDDDLATNLITVETAKLSYEANAKVLGTVKKLDRDTTDILA